jgi:hypothetical protein
MHHSHAVADQVDAARQTLLLEEMGYIDGHGFVRVRLGMWR